MATTYASTITNTTITATTLNTGVAASLNFSTSTRSCADANETSTGYESTNAHQWNFTPTKAGSKIVVIFDSHSTKAVKAKFKIPAGDLWAGKDITGSFGSTKATTNCSEASTIAAVTFDSARCLHDDGTINIIVSADTTDSLNLGHKLNVVCLELL
jgi:hypothetical protein